MTFQLPWRLMLLLIVLALILYRWWAIGRARRTTTALFLWKRVVAAAPDARKRRRLPPLEIFVEGALLSAAVFWAAAPAIERRTNNLPVVLIDETLGPLPAARMKEAEAQIAELKAERGGDPEIVRVPAADGDERAAALIDQAVAGVFARDRSILWLNAAPPPVADPRIRWSRLSAPIDDTGIIGGELVQDPRSGKTTLFYALARSAGAAAKDAELVFRAGTIERRFAVRIVPGGEARGAVAIELSSLPASADPELALAGRDDVPANDRLHLRAVANRIRAIVAGDLDAFADAILALGFESVSPGRAPSAGPADLWIGRGPRGSARAAIQLPDENTPGVLFGEARANGAETRAEDPSLAGFRPRTIRPIALDRSNADALAEIDGAAVIALRESDHAIILGFDPVAEGFDRTGRFPLFVRALTAIALRPGADNGGLRRFAAADPGAMARRAAAISGKIGAESADRSLAEAAPKKSSLGVWAAMLTAVFGAWLAFIRRGAR